MQVDFTGPDPVVQWTVEIHTRIERQTQSTQHQVPVAGSGAVAGQGADLSEQDRLLVSWFCQLVKELGHYPTQTD